MSQEATEVPESGDQGGAPEHGRSRERVSAAAVPRELLRVWWIWVRNGLLAFPAEVVRSLYRDPAFDGLLGDSRALDLFGQVALRLFDGLGPIYGKAGQMVLSRLSPPMHEIARTLRLTRLYKDWPPMPFSQVEDLLDREIPAWRTALRVDPTPLGVASLAQVHAAVDKDGREWVIKIIKPHAARRLRETVAAMEAMIRTLQPFAVTLAARRFLRESEELCEGFRNELSLRREAETIGRMRERIAGKRQRVLVIPDVNPAFSTDCILTVERFHGTPLSDVVDGKVPLPAGFRQKLARSVLHELLVQVFELGLFHADPHAGNLILMGDGSVGLFDWGLSGELMDTDRRHIAAILKAVIALDLEQLIDALLLMGQESGTEVSREEVRRELKSVITMVKRGQENPALKPSMQELFEACLKGAGRLGIDVPDGLLMMAKSLITIDGLARGIDPGVSMARVAGPVLFRAARPGIRDLMAMGRNLPKIAKRYMGW